jgi:hypothetical protein
MIDKFDTFNSRIKRSVNKPYKILVKYEHGDASFNTKETFEFKDEKSFNNILNFFYEIMNFKPNTAYQNMGYFYPITRGYLQGHCTGEEEEDKLLSVGAKYGLNEEDTLYTYLKRDDSYRRGYADILGIKTKVNGQNKVIVFKKALETNKVELPKIGDEININIGRIPGLGKKVFGGKWDDYMPNSGEKDYLVKDFVGKVIDCSIDFNHDYDNEYYTEYTSFNYVLLVEVDDPTKILKVPNTNKLTYSIHGYDPNFEQKFNKEKYDGLNFYELK